MSCNRSQILRSVFLVTQLVPKTAEVARTFHRVHKNNASVGLVLSHESRRHLPQDLQSCETRRGARCVGYVSKMSPPVSGMR